MEWIECTLGDILNFRRGYDLPHSEMKGGSVPVAGSNGVIGYHDVATDISPVITIGRSGNVGTPYFYSKAWAHNTTLYIDDFKGNDPLYLFYLLKTLPLSSFGGGSAVPTLNRNHIHPLEIKHCPDVKDQKRIAAVLKTFDDKIELNNGINHNLEEQALALFKEWFENDPACSEWPATTLSAFFNVVTGKKDANFSSPEGTYPFFTCSQVPLKAPSYSFDGKAILLAGNGDFNVKRYIGKFEAYQRTYVLMPFEGKYLSLLYLLILSHLADITGGSRGSVIKFITKGNIADYSFKFPSYCIDEKLDVLNSIFEQIDENKDENMRLSSMRDQLLPQIMKGSVRC